MSGYSPRSSFPQQLTALMGLETSLVAALAGTSSDMETLEAELFALLMSVGRGVLTSILGGLSDQESFDEEGVTWIPIVRSNKTLMTSFGRVPAMSDLFVQKMKYRIISFSEDDFERETTSVLCYGDLVQESALHPLRIGRLPSVFDGNLKDVNGNKSVAIVHASNSGCREFYWPRRYRAERRS